MSLAAIDLAPSLALCGALARLVEALLNRGRELTRGGGAIDDYQVECERLAAVATEARAAWELLRYAERSRAAGRGEPLVEHQAAAFVAEVAHHARAQIEVLHPGFSPSPGLVAETLASPQSRAAIAQGCAAEALAAIGRAVVERGGINECWLEDEMAAMARDSVRQFARAEVAPLAEGIHRRDELVPEDLIRKMAELGYFGMSIPEEHGGGNLGNGVMIVTTEELSAASLAAAGSLITRPEILTKALLQGGTEEQKKRWLPPIARGELMVAISVTEPDVGSDVASITCRADPAERRGKRGYLINGAKAWSTFAGRANLLALLARTDPDPTKGARGLSLFVVEKDPFPGHTFEVRQPGGGLLSGKADPTLGYRGMHSFTLSFEDFFVPAENLVGQGKGLGRGFYLQMAGFVAGRLQTGGRAVGLAQAALERTVEYVRARRQFGRPIVEFGLTQFKIGRMATHVAAARQITYAAARAMDAGDAAGLEAAMAKLFASDVAVWVTQEGQLLHGGWGYGEEFPISRYVVDALVLPIFEGVKPILELKVIARQLLGQPG